MTSNPTARGGGAGAPPAWAIRRVASAVPSGGDAAIPRDLHDLARRTGLTRRLVRRCLIHLDRAPRSAHTSRSATEVRPERAAR